MSVCSQCENCPKCFTNFIQKHQVLQTPDITRSATPLSRCGALLVDASVFLNEGESHRMSRYMYIDE